MLERIPGGCLSCSTYLFWNPKVYIDELTKNSSLQEILHALLEDYYIEITDKAYHRLMTADNVSKFRPEILERLEAHAKSKRYLETTAREFAEQESIGLEEAREKTLSLLHYVIASFRQMDDILEDINKKHSRYQRAAVNRARFLLTSGEDMMFVASSRPPRPVSSTVTSGRCRAKRTKAMAVRVSK